MASPGDFVRRTADEAARRAMNDLNIVTNGSAQGSWFIGKVSLNKRKITHPNGTIYNLNYTGQIQTYTLAIIIDGQTAYAPGNPKPITHIQEGSQGKAIMLTIQPSTANVYLQKSKDTIRYFLTTDPAGTNYIAGATSFVGSTVNGFSPTGGNKGNGNSIIGGGVISSAWAMTTDGKSVANIYTNYDVFAHTGTITISFWDNLTFDKDTETASAETMVSYTVPNTYTTTTTGDRCAISLSVQTIDDQRVVYGDYIHSVAQSAFLSPSITLWGKKVNMLTGFVESTDTFNPNSAVFGLSSPFDLRDLSTATQLYRGSDDNTASFWSRPGSSDPNQAYCHPDRTPVTLGLNFLTFPKAVISNSSDSFYFNQFASELFSASILKVLNTSTITTITLTGPTQIEMINYEYDGISYTRKKKVTGKIPSSTDVWSSGSNNYLLLDGAII